MIKKTLLAYLLLSLSPALFAQSVPSAEGPGRSIWVGAEMSTFNPDWGCKSSSAFSCWDKQLLGVAAFTDVNRLIGRVGIEGEARWLNWRGPGNGIKESTYLVGPRFQVFGGRRLSANVKFLAGGGIFHYPTNWDGWSVYAPGGTVGYRMSGRFLIRADYEYQMWPGWGTHGLTPNGFSVGASYRLFR